MTDYPVDGIAAQMADTMRAVLFQAGSGKPFYLGGALKQQIRDDLARAEALGVPVLEEGLQAVFKDEADNRLGSA